jgi:hypothetical protein
MCGGGLRQLFAAARAVGEEIGDSQLRGQRERIRDEAPLTQEIDPHWWGKFRCTLSEPVYYN